MATSATAATESATAAAVKHVTGGEDNYERPVPNPLTVGLSS
jgi:hypothetical protein